jgi:hypothetical protein
MFRFCHSLCEAHTRGCDFLELAEGGPELHIDIGSATGRHDRRILKTCSKFVVSAMICDECCVGPRSQLKSPLDCKVERCRYQEEMEGCADISFGHGIGQGQGRTWKNHKTSWELYIYNMIYYLCMDMYIIDCDSRNMVNENRLSIISQSWTKSSLKLYAGISFESGCLPYYASCLSFELSLSLLSDYINIFC